MPSDWRQIDNPTPFWNGRDTLLALAAKFLGSEVSQLFRPYICPAPGVLNAMPSRSRELICRQIQIALTDFADYVENHMAPASSSLLAPNHAVSADKITDVA